MSLKFISKHDNNNVDKQKINYINNNNDDEGENFVGNNVQQMIDDSFYDHFLRSLNDSMEKNDGKLYINYFDIKKENKDKNEIKTKKSEITKYRVNDQFKNVEKIDPKNKFRRSISAVHPKQHHFNIIQLQYCKNIHQRKKFDENKNKNNNNNNNKEILENKTLDSSKMNKMESSTIPNYKLNENKNKKSFFSCFSCL